MQAQDLIESQVPQLPQWENLLDWAMATGGKHGQVADGPDAARRFEDIMRRVLSVSKEELTRREAEYQDSRRDKTRTDPESTAKK